MKKVSAHEIALSGIACAFVVIFLTVGAYSKVLLFSGYLFSAVALMLPLAKRSFGGYALAYVGGSVLALIFNSARFWDVLPFIVFFGLHPLMNELQLRVKINTWVACFIKALWFDGAMYLIWRFVFGMSTTLDFVDQYAIPCILIAGTLFFVFYDYASYKCRGAVNSFVARFLKK